MHYPGDKSDYHTLTQNKYGDDRPVYSRKDAVGSIGLDTHGSFSILKRYAAKIKHSRRYATAPIDKNFIVLPGSFAKAARAEQFRVMEDIYRQYCNWGRKPQSYSKILVLGSIELEHLATHELYDHACLIVIDFTDDPIRIQSYDPGHRDDPAEQRRTGVMRYEEMNGMAVWLLNKHLVDRSIVMEDIRNQPRQKDAWNCGQYAIEFAKCIMKGVQPTPMVLSGIDVEKDEDWQPMYRWGRVDGDGYSHGTMDHAMRFFNTKRRRREQKLLGSVDYSMERLVGGKRWGGLARTRSSETASEAAEEDEEEVEEDVVDRVAARKRARVAEEEEEEEDVVVVHRPAAARVMEEEEEEEEEDWEKDWDST
jgi:hypothetical protein